jgi:hypothetical protein
MHFSLDFEQQSYATKVIKRYGSFIFSGCLFTCRYIVYAIFFSLYFRFLLFCRLLFMIAYFFI